MGRTRLFGMISTKPSLEFTALGLDSFFKHTVLRAGDRFVLLDNDGSFDVAMNSHPIEVIANSAPLGYAQNANQLIDLALAQGADLCLMNNDLVFAPGWLEECASTSTGIVSPLSNREVAYDLEWVKTPMQMQLEDYLSKREAIERLFVEHRRSTNGLMNVLILPFFCVLLAWEVLERVGHFDERFGKGGAEDYDYCLRARLAGFDVRYALSSFILHFGGKSSWSGVETREEQDAREFLFRSEFGIKWGVDLLKACLFEDRAYFAPETECSMLAQAGRHREIVCRLMGENSVDIKL